MLYNYRAKKGPQEIVEAAIEAQSEKEAIEKVSAMGYIPIKITLASASGEQRRISTDKPVRKIRSKEITIFSRQLASLLKSGVPILASLSIIGEQSENHGLKQVLRSIHNAVKDGATFSSSLQRFPKIFSPLYIAMIQTGESSGVLSEVLLRIAEYRVKEEEALSRFRMALAYPTLMGLVGIGTIIFMLTFVMPRLMKIFVNMGQQLPLPTRIVIATSSGLRHWWLWVGLALFVLVARKQMYSEAMKMPLSRLKMHIPLFGKLTLKSELGRFCRTLELLIKSGIPILRAIEVAIPVVSNEVIKVQLRLSYKELEQGGSFGKSLKNSKLFPSFVTNLIIVGEESGKLADALAEVASSYERDTDEAMKVLTNLLEPLMILAMGLIVGFMVIAMLLPIFEMNVMVR